MVKLEPGKPSQWLEARQIINIGASYRASLLICLGKLISELIRYATVDVISSTWGHNVQKSITVRVSYLEIYNEAMFDLLSPVPLAEQVSYWDQSVSAVLSESKMENGLSIVEDAKGNVAVKGLSCLVANTEEEALNHLFEGEMSRSIGEHQLNKTSSRSHCIFTLYVETSSRIKSDDRVTTSKLNLVDLAGKTHGLCTSSCRNYV